MVTKLLTTHNIWPVPFNWRRKDPLGKCHRMDGLGRGPYSKWENHRMDGLGGSPHSKWENHRTDGLGGSPHSKQENHCVCSTSILFLN